MSKKGISVSVSGVETTIKKVRQVTELQIRAIQDAINLSSLAIEGNAKRRCPVNYGRLRSSIRVRFSANNDGKNTVAKDVFTDVKYGPYIEFGTGIYAAKGDGRKTPWVYKDENGKFHKTRGMKARPFLYPAFQQESRELIRTLKALLSSNM